MSPEERNHQFNVIQKVNHRWKSGLLSLPDMMTTGGLITLRIVSFTKKEKSLILFGALYIDTWTSVTFTRNVNNQIETKTEKRKNIQLEFICTHIPYINIYIFSLSPSHPMYIEALKCNLLKLMSGRRNRRISFNFHVGKEKFNIMSQPFPVEHFMVFVRAFALSLS